MTRLAMAMAVVVPGAEAAKASGAVAEAVLEAVASNRGMVRQPDSLCKSAEADEAACAAEEETAEAEAAVWEATGNACPRLSHTTP